MSLLTHARTLALAAFAACAMIASAGVAATFEWRPQRPVRLGLPFAPGGAADVIARSLAPTFQELLGQPWVLDNRGGAGGSIAPEIVARSNPDGHTVYLGISTSITVNRALYKLSYDPLKDLLPVAMMTSGQYMMVVHPTVKAETLKDFVALAKAQPGALNYASSGIGGPSHLAAELFSFRAGIRMTNVPYKGGGPATNAIVAGEVHTLFVSLASAVPHVRAGRLRALGVTAARRSAYAPEFATIAEQGYPGFEMTTWYGIFVPAGTPSVIVRTLESAGAAALETPQVRGPILTQGFETAYKPQHEFAAAIRAEAAMWEKVIRHAGIKPE
ncbi:MAG: tripartite tricarboxylate transporter substrate binding protein [Burkholderiales bacterium]